MVVVNNSFVLGGESPPRSIVSTKCTKIPNEPTRNVEGMRFEKAFRYEIGRLGESIQKERREPTLSGSKSKVGE